VRFGHEEALAVPSGVLFETFVVLFLLFEFYSIRFELLFDSVNKLRLISYFCLHQPILPLQLNKRFLYILRSHLLRPQINLSLRHLLFHFFQFPNQLITLLNFILLHINMDMDVLLLRVDIVDLSVLGAFGFVLELGWVVVAVVIGQVGF